MLNISLGIFAKTRQKRHDFINGEMPVLQISLEPAAVGTLSKQ